MTVQKNLRITPCTTEFSPNLLCIFVQPLATSYLGGYLRVDTYSWLDEHLRVQFDPDPVSVRLFLQQIDNSS